MLTAKQAFGNIFNIISNARLTFQENDALKESLEIIVGRCEVADRLEDAAAKGTLKKPKKKDKKNGPTDKPTDVPGINQEDS